MEFVFFGFGERYIVMKGLTGQCPQFFGLEPPLGPWRHDGGRCEALKIW